MILFVTIILIIFTQSVHSNIENSTITDFSRCKVHYSRSESAYTQFFEITEQHRTNSSLLFDFHFSILAPRDAHILLSPSAKIERSDPVYEIVLGAGSNTFSDIRRLQKAAVKRSAKTKNLLSSLDIRSFWIHVSLDGLIEIGREGEELAFLSWKDTDPLPIQVFSFCTWPGVEAKWYYDCVREDGSVSNSEIIAENLSISEQLREYLLNNYDPYVVPVLHPDDLLEINFGSEYRFIELDEKSSKIILHGTMQFSWEDEKIQWDPKDFDGINDLHFGFRQIWRPDIFIYNSASGPGNDFLQTIAMTVNYNGIVKWITNVRIEAWCDALGLGHWPKDEHCCEIQLGFLHQGSYLIFKYESISEPETAKMPDFISEWHINKHEEGYYLIPAPWNTDGDFYINAFITKIYLQRSSNFLTNVYFVPLVVVAVSLLTTFWLSPIGTIRISLHCFQLVLLAIFITKLGLIIPNHPTSAPYIVLLYSYGVIAIIVALFFSIIRKNLIYINHSKQLPYFMYKFFSLKYVKAILYIQGSKFSESYDKLIDENTTCNDINIQEMWNLLGIALDRLLFVAYLFLIIICLSKPY